MQQDAVKRALITVTRLGKHLWQEAAAVDDEDWPPFWLYFTGATITIIVLVGVGSFAIESILSSVGLWAGSSHWGLVVEAPIQGYIDQHSKGLPVSPAAIIAIWGLTGLIMFTFSCFGSFGARIGWIIFGLFSCLAVYAGTRPPSQWTAAGVAAFTWSGASILALRFVDRRRSSRRNSTRTRPRRVSARTRAEEAERYLEELKKNALQAAKRRGYKDLDDYFGERGNQTIKVIAQELMMPATRVNSLRTEHLEAGISIRGTITPRKQREIRADVRSGNYTNSQICERHGCSHEVIKRIRARVEAFASEEKMDHDDASSPPLASQLSDSEQHKDV